MSAFDALIWAIALRNPVYYDADLIVFKADLKYKNIHKHIEALHFSPEESKLMYQKCIKSATDIDTSCHYNLIVR